MGEPNFEKLNGVVDRVVFRNDDNGWSVLEVSCNGQLETVVGTLPPISVGENVEITGKYTDHATFGKQFKVETLERRLPNDASAILRYLASGTVKGIGPSTATKIVRKFGEETLRIIEKNPERLTEISGISERRAEQIHEDFMAMYGLREAMMRLASFGLSPSESMKCWKQWGLGAEEYIKENPYILCGNEIRMSFERVDSLCEDRHFLADDPRRVKAALIYVLRHNLQNGHTCIPTEKVIEVTANLLSIPNEKVIDAKLSLQIKKEIIEEVMGEHAFLFLPDYYNAEKNIAKIFREKMAFPTLDSVDTDQWIAHAEKITHMQYEGEQRTAIKTALSQKLLILTGGPGTGKTTTLKAIIRLLNEQGEKVLLAAPTGRAAKRMSELTGEDASTIHRLLEVQWNENDELYFEKTAYNPLEADTVIIDELSMVDVLVFSSLVDALPPSCRLIMVGDANQLPPVGAGNVIGDLIESECIPTVHLSKVFRQAMESQIVVNAHNIVSGKLPVFIGKESDCFFMKTTDSESTLNMVIDLCNERLPKKYNYSVFDGIQVLSPAKKGRIGTEQLNISLQAICNPEDPSKPEWEFNGKLFRTGDKVMQLKNNYNLEWFKMNGKTGTGVYNGDIGTIIEIQKRNDLIAVRFDDDREVHYNREAAEDLDLAYATTVHKSQGSEFEIVVLPLYDVPKLLCYRNLLYTAVTRAKQLLIIIGDDRILNEMVKNDKKTRRYSALKKFLINETEENLLQ